ncbi:hypothetical protein K1719_020107 [Acacia pycnantha]|nr:hypothetical protein K1719_020107 [Acacia pycnantha]
MAKEVTIIPSTTSFDYVVLGDDHENLRAVRGTPTHTSPRIKPERLKLRHRIGRGPFGGLWLATHHQTTEDYDEQHEVAIKMFYPIKEDNLRTVLEKFDELYHKCQGVTGACWLHGI